MKDHIYIAPILHPLAGCSHARSVGPLPDPALLP